MWKTHGFPRKITHGFHIELLVFWRVSHLPNTVRNHMWIAHIPFLMLHTVFLHMKRHMCVGGFNPLKNMSSSVGMMTFPTEWKVIKSMFQTTNQYQSEYASKVSRASTPVKSSMEHLDSKLQAARPDPRRVISTWRCM